MSVKDFECQIARGQIGRYVGGETLSPEALRQLGLHVAECESCRDHLDRRRASLQSMVASGVSGAAVATEAVGEPRRPRPETLAEPRRAVTHTNNPEWQRPPSRAAISPAAQALLDQMRRKSGDGLPLQDREPKFEAPAAVVETSKRSLKPLLGRPALYSLGLAAVLIAMTYISRNPTGFLGPKAGSAGPASPGQASSVQASAGQAGSGQAGGKDLTAGGGASAKETSQPAGATNKTPVTAAKSGPVGHGPGEKPASATPEAAAKAAPAANAAAPAKKSEAPKPTVASTPKAATPASPAPVKPEPAKARTVAAASTRRRARTARGRRRAGQVVRVITPQAITVYKG